MEGSDFFPTIPVMDDPALALTGDYAQDRALIQSTLETMTMEAVVLLRDIIRGTGAGENASLRLRAQVADKHLARVGFGPIQMVKVSTVHGVMTAEQIAAVKERALAGYYAKHVGPAQEPTAQEHV